MIIFFGAEFTHTWATRQRRVEPMPHAESGAAPQKKSEAATEQATRTAGYDLDTTSARGSPDATRTLEILSPYALPPPTLPLGGVLRRRALYQRCSFSGGTPQKYK